MTLDQIEQLTLKLFLILIRFYFGISSKNSVVIENFKLQLRMTGLCLLHQIIKYQCIYLTAIDELKGIKKEYLLMVFWNSKEKGKSQIKISNSSIAFVRSFFVSYMDFTFSEIIVSLLLLTFSIHHWFVYSGGTLSTYFGTSKSSLSFIYSTASRFIIRFCNLSIPPL